MAKGADDHAAHMYGMTVHDGSARLQGSRQGQSATLTAMRGQQFVWYLFYCPRAHIRPVWTGRNPLIPSPSQSCRWQRPSARSPRRRGGVGYFERDGCHAKDDGAHRKAGAWAGRGAAGPLRPGRSRRFPVGARRRGSRRSPARAQGGRRRDCISARPRTMVERRRGGSGHFTSAATGERRRGSRPAG